MQDLSRRLGKGDLNLPPCPEIAIRIQGLLEADDVCAEELALITLRDPILTGRIISLANSAIFSRAAHPTSDIRTAIARVGFDMVKALAFEVALDKAFDLAGGSGLHGLNRAIRRHSRQVGVLGQLLARRHLPGVPEYEAMLAGLLHEVGKLYILARADAFPDLFGDPGTLAELLGDWHSALGHAILGAWGLPESVVSAVGEQDGVDGLPKGAATVATLLRAAIALNGLCDAGAEAADQPLAALPALRCLGLDELRLRTLVKHSCGLARSVGALGD